MRLETRKLLDRSFTGSGLLAILLLAVALGILLAPMAIRGVGAVFFQGTIEHRRLLLDRFGRGDRMAVDAEWTRACEARAPMYRVLVEFERRLAAGDAEARRRYARPLRDLNKALQELFGPPPGAPRPMLPRDQYGQTRWDRTRVKLDHVLFREAWDYSDPSKSGILHRTPRAAEFEGTPVAAIFLQLEKDIEAMMRPRRTVYLGFFTDDSLDSHFFGGIRHEILGTLYLTLGAMLFAVPMGLIAAIYLTEYASDHRLVGLLRTCISALAGVPSIVFGLFGLAFFIHTLKVSPSKSVLAGSLTLALMILPTIIRASEEALRAVPQTYREAALSLGAGRWHVVRSILLPAALPGILTGIVISMGRAAGETAPIIFTAAVSVGRAPALARLFSQPTPAMSWNIYNLATEHEAVDEIRHVQYGLVLTLVTLVLLLNLTAILLRARISRRLQT